MTPIGSPSAGYAFGGAGFSFVPSTTIKVTQISYRADGSTNPVIRFWSGTNTVNTLLASYDLSPGSNDDVIVTNNISPLTLTAGQPYTYTLQNGPLSSSNAVLLEVFFTYQPAPEITSYNVAIQNEDSTFSSFGNIAFFFGPNFAYEVPFQINSIVQQSNDINITWQAPTGSTNALQMTTGTANGGYATNNFTDIFIITNSTSAMTNYLDIGAAAMSTPTNPPSRYYRVRLVQ